MDASRFTSWRQHAFFWLAYFGTSFCLWLLFVNTTKPHELWMAAGASVFAATAAEFVRSESFAPFRPRVKWIMEAWREPWYIIEGCSSIFWALLKHFFKPEPSVLRELPFDPGGTDPASCARRALAVTYTTIPPNFVVLDIDERKKVMLVHQVSASGTPAVARNLGAKA